MEGRGVSAPPSHARAVIVGGGIVGLSTAYHLAREGWTDIVVLEANKLTSGSTWHAAGLVGQLRNSANITRLLGHSVALYERLEAETGQATGWRQTGGLRLACNQDRLTELKRQVTVAHSFGLEMEIVSPREAQDLWPAMQVDDVVGAAWLPSDGQTNPSDTAMALAAGARRAGVKILEDCPVTGIRVEKGRATGVMTRDGEVACEVVVNCAGQWARALGAMAGVAVPLASMEHQYLITEAIPGLPRDLPTLRDPDRRTYYKEEVGGLVMGGYEPDPQPWARDGVPEGFHFSLLNPVWERFEQHMENAVARVLALETAGVKQLLNGPESFTPDGWFILGEAPELRNFYVGAGFNAFGIASAGGAGKALAEWIAGGEPPMDLWAVDIRRFGRPHGDPDYVRTLTVEACARHYDVAYPHGEQLAGRPLRVSPLYERLDRESAVFGVKLGWERANWFALGGAARRDEPGFDRPNWFQAVAREHRACREAAALFDASSFAKFLVSGRDAETALNRLCANDIARAPGRVVYTQMLNTRGGIEADLTVTRLDADTFYIVTGTGFATRDADWITRHLRADGDARLIDMTSAYAVLSLMGPRARDILAAVTRDDVSNAALPFATCRTVMIAGAPVRALRMTYVGELGFELHIPAESAGAVFDALQAAGQPHGMALGGYRAIESLRLEKGYRAWGSDIGPDHTPVEAGLAWACKTGTDIDFVGRGAIEEQRAKGVAKQLACFTVDDPAVLLHGRETIFRDGEQVGWLTSGGYGHTVERSIGYGYVRHPGIDRDYLASGRYELEVATTRIPASLHLEALVDPANTRVRG
jgi:sarcosine dehydrogenase